MTRLPVALLLMVTGCTTAGVNGRYVGPVTPNTPGPQCQPSRALLQVRGANLFFAPDEGTWVLDGTLAPNGHIEAAKTRPVNANTTYETTFEGQLTADAVTGLYKTPRCTSMVSLKKL